MNLRCLTVHSDCQPDRRLVDGAGKIAMQRTAGHRLVRTNGVLRVQRESPLVRHLEIIRVVYVGGEGIILIDRKNLGYILMTPSRSLKRSMISCWKGGL